MAKKLKKKKIKKHIEEGMIYIKSTFNNTVITLTDKEGNVLCWESAGSLGYKGTRKSTPYAASVVARSVASKAKEFGLKRAEIFVKGVGTGRDSATRALGLSDIYITRVVDVTPIPHNGCRPKKPRKV